MGGPRLDPEVRRGGREPLPGVVSSHRIPLPVDPGEPAHRAPRGERWHGQAVAARGVRKHGKVVLGVVDDHAAAGEQVHDRVVDRGISRPVAHGLVRDPGERGRLRLDRLARPNPLVEKRLAAVVHHGEAHELRALQTGRLRIEDEVVLPLEDRAELLIRIRRPMGRSLRAQSSSVHSRTFRLIFSSIFLPSSSQSSSSALPTQRANPRLIFCSTRSPISDQSRSLTRLKWNA